ncbi:MULTISPECIES: hypothetical protein [unclassified Flavobacterium]|uniref:hypothetical protein n=1 Tax=unclassified Flavobacterium TaxID=196869 RepID=UPI0018E8EAA0|nr:MULTISPECIES: hypothetical protein [unclassified Flavobacterium]MBJ2125695.1 hypothetical protein [Flavobacterium sp. IB48]
MIRKITQILFVLTLLLSFSGCRDTKQNIQAFVNSYNKSAANFSNDIITSTEAKAFLDQKRIEITMETIIESNAENKSMYTQLFPNFLKEMFSTDREIKGLIEDGVVIKVDFLGSDNTSIAEFEIDKKELDELIKKNAGKPVVSVESVTPNGGSELGEMLVMMNRNMPLKNSDGSKVLKIYHNDKNQLVYQVEMPDDIIEILKNNTANSLVKESILRQGQIQKVASMIQRYGIKDIKYEYFNAKGKMINTLVLTEKDLQL